jgi:hypothetical protein
MPHQQEKELGSTIVHRAAKKDLPRSRKSKKKKEKEGPSIKFPEKNG